MDAELEKIHQVLQKLIGLHRQLLELVRAEKTALEQADIKGVQEAVYGKEVVIHAVKQNELERIRLIASLAAEWRQPIADISLPKFVVLLQGKDKAAAERFRSAQNALTILLARITEQNQENGRLVQKSLEHIAVMKRNALGETSSKSGTYTQKGKRTDTAAGSRLISKEI